MAIERTVEKVSPRKAEAWLNANKTNRSLRDGVVERYADDMRNGRWTTCLMPISFYADGDLADGQHRLYAIIESDTTQEFEVVRGLDRQAGLNIDTGLNRSLVDSARISGAKEGLSNEMISWARAVVTGKRSTEAMSNSRKLDMVVAHEEALRWTSSNGPRSKGLRNSVVCAAVVRSLYHESDRERLQAFCRVFDSGFMEDPEKDSAAVAMRNYIKDGGAALVQGNTWTDTFWKMQNAIWYFMRGKSLKVIKKVAEERYPLAKPAAPKGRKAK